MLFEMSKLEFDVVMSFFSGKKYSDVKYHAHGLDNFYEEAYRIGDLLIYYDGRTSSVEVLSYGKTILKFMKEFCHKYKASLPITTEVVGDLLSIDVFSEKNNIININELLSNKYGLIFLILEYTNFYKRVEEDSIDVGFYDSVFVQVNSEILQRFKCLDLASKCDDVTFDVGESDLESYLIECLCDFDNAINPLQDDNITDDMYARLPFELDTFESSNLDCLYGLCISNPNENNVHFCRYENGTDYRLEFSDSYGVWNVHHYIRNGENVVSVIHKFNEEYDEITYNLSTHTFVDDIGEMSHEDALMYIAGLLTAATNRAKSITVDRIPGRVHSSKRRRVYGSR